MTHYKKNTLKYLIATIAGLSLAGTGLLNSVAAQTVPTIVSLPGAPTRAGVKLLAVRAVESAIQTGGTLQQVQNVAAQQLLGNLNAPNAVNPNGGTVTLTQALLLVNAAAAQVSAGGGIVVPTLIGAQPGQPGTVTISVVQPFTPEQLAILAQMTAAAAQALPVQPVQAPPTVPVVIPPVTPPPVSTPPAVQPTNPATIGGIVFFPGATSIPDAAGGLPTFVSLPVFSIPRINGGLGPQPPIPAVMAVAITEIAAELQAGFTPSLAVSHVAETFAAQISARQTVPYVGSQFVPFLTQAAALLQGINPINGSLVAGVSPGQNPAFLASVNSISQAFLATPIVNQPVVLVAPQDEIAALQLALTQQAAASTGAVSAVQPVVTVPVVTLPTVTPPAPVPSASSPGVAPVATIQQFAVNALVAAAEAQAQVGGSLALMQNAAAQSLLSQLNSSNTVSSTIGTITLSQALLVVTSDPAAAEALLVPVSQQAMVLLAQNEVAALQQALAVQTAANAAALPSTQPVATPPIVTPAVTPPVVVLPIVTPPVIISPAVVTTPILPTQSGKTQSVVAATVSGTALPDFTPAQLSAIGLPQCYPFCIPFTGPITGVVTPSGGKGVQLAGPVTPIVYKLVFKAGLPFIEQSGNGVLKALFPVPPQFLVAPAQLPVVTPTITPTVVTPPVIPGTIAPIFIPAQNGGQNNGAVQPPVTQPVVTPPVNQTPANSVQSGGNGSGGGQGGGGGQSGGSQSGGGGSGSGGK